MADNPLVVQLLIEFKNEASITRTEVGRIVGKTRGQIAGICNRNNIVDWPQIPKLVRLNRCCQYPVGTPGEEGFHLCGKRKAPGHSFLCIAHEANKWRPEARIIPLGNT